MYRRHRVLISHGVPTEKETWYDMGIEQCGIFTTHETMSSPMYACYRPRLSYHKESNVLDEGFKSPQ